MLLRIYYIKGLALTLKYIQICEVSSMYKAKYFVLEIDIMK